MKNQYIYVVVFNCVPDHYTVMATTDIEAAVLKKIQKNNYEIEIWFNEIEVGIYGDLQRHYLIDYEKIINGVTDIIKEFELK